MRTLRTIGWIALFALAVIAVTPSVHAGPVRPAVARADVFNPPLPHEQDHPFGTSTTFLHAGNAEYWLAHTQSPLYAGYIITPIQDCNVRWGSSTCAYAGTEWTTHRTDGGVDTYIIVSTLRGDHLCYYNTTEYGTDMGDKRMTKFIATAYCA